MPAHTGWAWILPGAEFLPAPSYIFSDPPRPLPFSDRSRRSVPNHIHMRYPDHTGNLLYIQWTDPDPLHNPIRIRPAVGMYKNGNRFCICHPEDPTRSLRPGSETARLFFPVPADRNPLILLRQETATFSRDFPCCTEAAPPKCRNGPDCSRKCANTGYIHYSPYSEQLRSFPSVSHLHRLL